MAWTVALARVYIEIIEQGPTRQKPQSRTHLHPSPKDRKQPHRRTALRSRYRLSQPRSRNLRQ